MQHVAGLLAVLGEHMALLDAFGTFAPREWRLVERDMADQIEGVVVATHLFGQLIQKHAVGGQFIDQYLFALGFVPGIEEGVE